LLLSFPVPAIAAPFCVGTEAVPPQCIYYDANSCQQRALQLGSTGQCSVNPNEAHLTPSIGHYCLVTSGMAGSAFILTRLPVIRRQRGSRLPVSSRPVGRKAPRWIHSA
jgi:hypothetical protein